MNPRSMTIAERLRANVAIDAKTGCWIWTARRDRKGYGTFSINNRPARAHRQSFMEFVGPIPPGHYVCHKCDTPSCINPAHLFAGTPLDNSQDCIRKGRQRALGEGSKTAKLKNKEVLEIRALLEQGRTNVDIGKLFGVSESTVRRIAAGSIWRHL